MMKLKDLFNLPSTPVDLAEAFFTLNSRWVPEIGSIVPDYDESVSSEVAKDGRLEIKTLVYENFDGERYAQMCTVWFDAKPVLLVQQAGRSGRDHFNRWLVDTATYTAMLAYLIEKFTRTPEAEMENFIDPETEVYPEELLHFYGNSYAEKLGIAIEPPLEGVQLLGNTRGLLGHLPLSQYLVFVKKAVPGFPEYIRRQGFVMQKIRLISLEEIAAHNPNMAKVVQENGETVYLYQKSVAPKGVYVQPV